jgi:hypothetical protein
METLSNEQISYVPSGGDGVSLGRVAVSGWISIFLGVPLLATLCAEAIILLWIAPNFMMWYANLGSANIPWPTRVLFDGARIVPWSVTIANLLLVLTIAWRRRARLAVVLIAFIFMCAFMFVEILSLYLPLFHTIGRPPQ